MKLSNYTNEEAIDLLADIIEPTSKIFGDKNVAAAVQRKATKLEIVKIALKNHKKEIVEILARLSGQAVADYKCNIITITTDILEILNDKELVDFFTLQGAMMDAESSGSATESTGV